MKNKPTILTALASFALVASPGLARGAVAFGTGSDWNYFIGTAEASNPREAWRVVGFNDSAWTTGPAPVGYGEPDIVTTIPSSASGGYSSVFFRKIFAIEDPANVSQITLNIRVDDGLILWINGTEIGRENVGDGDLPYNVYASSSVEPHDLTFTVTSGLSTLLQAGDNVVAVQVFNGASSSSDLYLDGSLSVIEPDPIPPTIASVSPAPGTLTELSQLTVTFSETVANVNGPDLVLNGVAATSVVGTGDSYTFFFPQPAFGSVQISWADGHGIVDLGVPPNPFDGTAPGATWQYQLVDVVAPTVISVVPSLGATVLDLNQIQVGFSENVSGVDKSDLLINGVAATNVTAFSGGQYVFQFPEPPTGAVSVAWSASHGITDLATSPNPFAGGMWTYQLDPNATAAALFITEFLAVNDHGLTDEDGDYSDWIEIHNNGEIAASLEGWYLTDNAGNLTKWRFPQTNLMAGGYMVIFASEKNRRVPGAPLHTNFKLTSSGEYLALVRPDGLTVVSAFSPTYPPQIPDVSYGLLTASAPTTLLAEGGNVSVLVPVNGNLGRDWTRQDFDDSSWLHLSNGVGFEGNTGTSPNLSGAFRSDIMSQMRNHNSSAFLRFPFQVVDPAQFDFLTLRMKYDDGFIAYLNGQEVARRNAFVTVANSAADFSDTQGSNNWFYGYYNKTADPDRSYDPADFIPFPKADGAWSANNFWTGTKWDWFGGNPPWTEISVTDAHPNGSNNGDEHWAVRRWVSEVAGNVTVRFRLAKSNVGGGNGVTGRIFHNGTEVFSKTIAFNDASAVTNVVRIYSVAEGDFLDFALDSTGTDGLPSDGSDGSTLTAVIDWDEGAVADWNVAASQARAEADALNFEDVDVSGGLIGLQAGSNVLAVQGLNVGVSDDDFLIAAELQSRTQAVLTSQPRYFTSPTPGAPNGVGADNLGPVLSNLKHVPNAPREDEALLVTAEVIPTFAPVSSVQMHYRVMYSNEVSVAMTDNGQGADAVAGDGIYSAVIPAAAASTGQMIRWFISSSDTQGHTTRLPAFEDPNNSPEYDGTIVDVEQTNNLPILHWFSLNPSGANGDAGARSSLFYDGEFYDNVLINIHGQSSRGFPKKSYDIDFNPGDNFRWQKGENRVDDINLLTTYPDKAHMRNMLAYGTYRDAGASYHFVVPVRVHQNGAFLGDWHMVENGDDNWLERIGLDPRGALYKMYNTFSSLGDTTIGANGNLAEKKTRKQEGNADLVDLYNGIVISSASAKTNYIFDHVNIPATVNFLASRILTGDVDCCHKNYYIYRDSEGTGEWEGMPWDVDLSFGRVWNSTESYWDNDMFPNTGLFIGSNNGFFNALFQYQPTRQMYLRRIRTLMDTLLQPTNTLPHKLHYEAQINAFAAQLGPDAALDLAKNGLGPTGRKVPSSPRPIRITKRWTNRWRG
jgi:CotH kinase protein/Lamin Tail Domain